MTHNSALSVATTLSLIAVLFAPLSGCQRSADPPAATEVAANGPSHSGPPAMDAPGALDAAFSGEVIERVPAGSYCYLHIQADDGRDHWVATVGKGHPIGASVRVKSMGVRDDFHSNRLGRTFEHLVFGIVKPTSSDKSS